MRWSVLLAGVAVAAVVAVPLEACTGERSERAAPEIFDLEAGYTAGLDPTAAEQRAVIPAADLEALLEGLLAEHAELVADVMVAAADGGNTGAAVEALQQNTVELTGAINTVYGPAGARAFDQLWGQHTQFFAEYAVASGDDDQERRNDAFAKLHDYHRDFSTFTDTATGGAAPAEVVVELLHTHVDDLTGYIDAHTSGDDTEAEARLDSATSYMSVIAEALAGAIAAQDPQRFPS
jgi:hypothetical protein